MSSNEIKNNANRWIAGAGFGGFAAGALVAIVALRAGAPIPGLDPNSVAGTMVVRDGQVVAQDIAQLNLTDGPITGSINFHRRDGVVSADFDVNSSTPVEVRLELPEAGMAFGGVAEAGLPLPPAMVQENRITMMSNGERRFAVYLNQANTNAKAVKVVFLSGGNVIREETVDLPRG